MKYRLLSDEDRTALLARLAGMPAYVEAAFGALSADAAARRAIDGGFSPVEQVWHLADLETEGFAYRIARLRTESEPQLDDFDGDLVARERRYRERDLAVGMAAFRQARARTVELLQGLPDDAWLRRGTQAGVGPVMLCDLPVMVDEHDAAHRAEIDAWTNAKR